MVFAPTNNPNDTSDQTLANIPFFPDVAVATFRAATRVQDTVTDERVIQALHTAIIDVNRELATWRAGQEVLGYTALAQVPSDAYGEISEKTHQYLTAVYSKAKAQIIEVYRDTDTTVDGAQRADEFEATRDGYLREAREAIRNLLGLAHVTVELI